MVARVHRDRHGAAIFNVSNAMVSLTAVNASCTPLRAQRWNAAGVPSDELMANAVAARRAQWDNLVWQVPVLSLTAQAFWFTTALGVGVSRTARVVSALLSLIVTLLSPSLMARHRQAEVADALWLQACERNVIGSSEPVHGPAWRVRRDATNIDAGWIGRFTPMPRAYGTRAIGLSLLSVAALAVLVVAIAGSNLLK